jgi:lipopolysaccharide biosynthesis glycosyltransferase
MTQKTLAKAPSTDVSYPPELVVLVTPQVAQVTRNAISLHCTRLIEVDPIPNPDQGKNKADEYTKLRIWELAQYDRILYMDGDCLVTKDVSHLLYSSQYNCDPQWNGFSAAPDMLPASDKFNSGVMLIRPSSNIFDAMMSQKYETSFGAKVSGFLNSFFCDWYTSFPPSSRLPLGYNAQSNLYRQHALDWRQVEQDGLHVIHYREGVKPWKVSPDDEASWNPLIARWWEVNNEMANALPQLERNAASARKTAPPSAPIPSLQQRKPVISQQDMHKQIQKRYKLLRKDGNLDTKQAMIQARHDCGHIQMESDHGDAGAQVANMFGLGAML